MRFQSGHFYHLFNRGAAGTRIFFSDDNFRFCLYKLHYYTSRERVKLHAYCLMPNHYHFLMEQLEGGSISKCVQHLFNGYTQAVNKSIGRTGTLFEGKVKSRELGSDEHAAKVCAYIHLNPVSAGIVQRPEEWQFSDYGEWVDETKLNCESISLRDRLFGSGINYRDFVEDSSGLLHEAETYQPKHE